MRTARCADTKEIRPCLIQRGIFREPPPEQITGPDSILNWDYMGSAEFEFGALPASLRRIDARHADYVMHETPHVSHDGHRLYLYCPGDPAPCLEALSLVAKSDRGFQEKPYLKQRLEAGKDFLGREIGLDHHSQRFGLWWDIENDWMAVLGEENAVRVMLAMDALHEKWARRSA